MYLFHLTNQLGSCTCSSSQIKKHKKPCRTELRNPWLRQFPACCQTCDKNVWSFLMCTCCRDKARSSHRCIVWKRALFSNSGHFSNHPMLTVQSPAAKRASRERRYANPRLVEGNTLDAQNKSPRKSTSRKSLVLILADLLWFWRSCQVSAQVDQGEHRVDADFVLKTTTKTPPEPTTGLEWPGAASRFTIEATCVYVCVCMCGYVRVCLVFKRVISVTLYDI